MRAMGVSTAALPIWSIDPSGFRAVARPHVGRDETGHDGVHPHPVLAHLDGHQLGQAATLRSPLRSGADPGAGALVLALSQYANDVEKLP